MTKKGNTGCLTILYWVFIGWWLVPVIWFVKKLPGMFEASASLLQNLVAKLGISIGEGSKGRRNAKAIIVGSIALALSSCCLCSFFYSLTPSGQASATEYAHTRTLAAIVETEQYYLTLTAIPTHTLTPAATFTPLPTETIFIAQPTETPIPPAPEQSVVEGAKCIPQQEPQPALVTNVVDGDTIDVLIDGQEYRVRYIGIDTPETVHPSKPVEFYGPEASNMNGVMVGSKEVMLYKDLSETDQYDRLLRFVIVDGMFVNYKMVKDGFANASRYPPDVACAEAFAEAERIARDTKAGLWGEQPPEEPAVVVPQQPSTIEAGISIGQIFYDGVESNKEPDEFVEIVNNGTAAIDLAGWSLHDEAGKTFWFPAYQIQPGTACRVYTNQDHPEYCGFNYRNGGQAIWNNGGDCATLKDSSGQEVDNKCY